MVVKGVGVDVERGGGGDVCVVEVGEVWWGWSGGCGKWEEREECWEFYFCVGYWCWKWWECVFDGYLFVYDVGKEVGRDKWGCSYIFWLLVFELVVRMVLYFSNKVS